jgi:hypothetical protein
MLLVIVVLPSAVTAAQTGFASDQSALSYTMTLPLPPGSGFPLDPPSKKPTRVMVSLSVSLSSLRSFLVQLSIASATRILVTFPVVYGKSPRLYLLYASTIAPPALCTASSTFCSFLPSGWHLSTFHLQIAVTMTATPTDHISSAVLCKCSQCFSWAAIPHLTNHGGILFSLKPKMSSRAPSVSSARSAVGAPIPLLSSLQNSCASGQLHTRWGVPLTSAVFHPCAYHWKPASGPAHILSLFTLSLCLFCVWYAVTPCIR